MCCMVAMRPKEKSADSVCGRDAITSGRHAITISRLEIVILEIVIANLQRPLCLAFLFAIRAVDPCVADKPW